MWNAEEEARLRVKTEINGGSWGCGRKEVEDEKDETCLASRVPEDTSPCFIPRLIDFGTRKR